MTGEDLKDKPFMTSIPTHLKMVDYGYSWDKMTPPKEDGFPEEWHIFQLKGRPCQDVIGSVEPIPDTAGKWGGWWYPRPDGEPLFLGVFPGAKEGMLAVELLENRHSEALNAMTIFLGREA